MIAVRSVRPPRGPARIPQRQAGPPRQVDVLRRAVTGDVPPGELRQRLVARSLPGGWHALVDEGERLFAVASRPAAHDRVDLRARHEVHQAQAGRLEAGRAERDAELVTRHRAATAENLLEDVRRPPRSAIVDLEEAVLEGTRWWTRGRSAQSASAGPPGRRSTVGRRTWIRKKLPASKAASSSASVVDRHPLGERPFSRRRSPGTGRRQGRGRRRGAGRSGSPTSRCAASRRAAIPSPLNRGRRAPAGPERRAALRSAGRPVDPVDDARWVENIELGTLLELLIGFVKYRCCVARLATSRTSCRRRLRRACSSPCAVSRQLHGGRVGEVLALAADRELDDPRDDRSKDRKDDRQQVHDHHESRRPCPTPPPAAAAPESEPEEESAMARIDPTSTATRARTDIVVA